jgi:hypothetical protein
MSQCVFRTGPADGLFVRFVCGSIQGVLHVIAWRRRGYLGHDNACHCPATGTPESKVIWYGMVLCSALTSAHVHP